MIMIYNSFIFISNETTSDEKQFIQQIDSITKKEKEKTYLKLINTLN